MSGPAQLRHGGDLIAAVLAKWNIPCVFTLCGGHISPILVGAKDAGLQIIDCRDEKNAVFAADALARVTGLPGVAAVTAGPGVTNAITALKNAQLAQSPLVLFGGATATVLKGRGALQDIDQIELVQGAVKWHAKVSTVKQLGPMVQRALEEATGGVPGPVFLEVPVDVLYPEKIVKDWYLKESGVENAKSLGQKAIGLYLKGHLYRQFHAPHLDLAGAMPELPKLRPVLSDGLEQAVKLLRKAERPALVIGSQTMVNCKEAAPLARAIESMGIPVWLGGMSRGLLGKDSALQFRHARGKALKDADVVVVCGFPFDFRLKYGLGIGRKAKVIAANLSSRELKKNRTPQVALQMHAGDFLVRLAEKVSPQPKWKSFIDACREREQARDAEIRSKANAAGPLVDPLHFFLRLEEKLADDSMLVVDGGDFVATAAYILKPRGPLSWLDPGVFGTLGVGGGFAVGAAAARPKSEVWIIYGDGSSAYSLAEFDTFARHGMAPIAVIGTDASWGQIARDQVTILGSDVGTALRRTAYHEVAQGYGGVGLLLDDPAKTDEVIDQAKALSRQGKPVCINVHLRKTDFREGSISI
ncbi:MAG: thiamine pyrophosphate-binding protein [Myxococcaceae bacterium]|nr:thiamine pyrophosphate-binding protein [Myxococcaceae bacterium]